MADSAALQHFFAQEMNLFFKHLHAAVDTFGETGELPKSLFTKSAVKAVEKEGGAKRKRGDAGAKRKPSVFNMFIKEKLAEMKAAGGGAAAGPGAHADNFKAVTAAWSGLSEQQKAHYAAKYAPAIAAFGGDGAGPSAAPAAGEADAEEADTEEDSSESEPPPPPPTSEKKKKKHHKEKHND